MIIFTFLCYKEPLSARSVFTVNIDKLLGKWKRSECFVTVLLVSLNGTVIAPDNTLFLSSFIEAKLLNANVEVSGYKQVSIQHENN